MRFSSMSRIGIVLALIVVLAVASVPAFAAAAAATPTPAATAVSRIGIGNWQTIAGQPHEFTFVYNGGDARVEIFVGEEPANSIGFTVYTDQQWRDMGLGARDVAPLGRGTHNDFVIGDLYWAGSGRAGGFYHVQVYSLSGQEAHYWIALSGASDGGLVAVSPAPAAAGVATAATSTPAARAIVRAAATVTATVKAALAVTPTVKAAAVVTPTVKPVVAVKPTAPVTATVTPRTGVGNWQVLSGQPQEFTFQAVGGELVAVHVGADPTAGVGFSVYTDQQWRDGEDPVGHGTPNSYVVGDLYWATDSKAGGLYHVQVYKTGTAAASFWIAVDGPGASNLTAVTPALTAK